MPAPRVVAVAPGSPAARAGVQVGDEVHAIDGVSVEHVRATDGDHNDGGLLALALAAELAEATPEERLDSLVDAISFGLAPAVLAFAWGVQFIDPTISVKLRGQIFNAGYFIAFLFLLCGACRLARFNIQKNPVPKNPGRPDRKYFVGLPIPAAAALVGAAAEVTTWLSLPISSRPAATSSMRKRM